MNKQLLDSLAQITPEEQSLLDGSPVDMGSYASGRAFKIDSAKMLEKGKLIAVRPHTRFADFPRHTHDYVEIIYMCSGQTTHIINDDTTVVLKKGELLLLNQHASHAIKRAEQNDIGINFIVLPQFLDTALEMIGTENVLGDFILSSLRKDTSEMGYLYFQVSDILPVQNLLENMVWSIINKQPNQRRINQISMGLLFLQLLNLTDRLAIVSSQTKYDNALVMAALKEIEENYCSANLLLVAHEYNISLSYLSRIIKKATGMKYKELLQNKRLSKAAQLLKETRLTVQDIITAVGYDNSSYFYRIFREKYGTNPCSYRKT